jgi:hypothetical protein
MEPSRVGDWPDIIPPPRICKVRPLAKGGILFRAEKGDIDNRGNIGNIFGLSMESGKETEQKGGPFVKGLEVVSGKSRLDGRRS